ncbi:MAG: subclass B3 metallo-beta-lactamase [Pyrinomonadaceae bacterium]|nr:subclass B3 metallo-beta-lactamase [Pyrinomonadaceae bacterium]
MKFKSFLLILLFSVSIFAQKDERDRKWNQPVEPFKIIGNVYYVGVTEITSFLIATPKGHILIDEGFTETAPIIKENIAKLGFKIQDVKILLNTQAHYDHAGGLAELKRATGAKMLISAEDRILIENGGKNDFAFGDGYLYEPVKVDKVIKDGEIIKLGNVSLKVISTPGHTKGCTSFWLEVKENGKKYGVLFHGSTTAPGYKFPNEKYPNIITDYEKTFSVLKKLKPDVFLASHGNFFDLLGKIEKLNQNKSINPFIESQTYQDYLADTEKDLREKIKSQQTKKEAKE